MLSAGVPPAGVNPELDVVEPLDALAGGGRIFLVTVRPNEQLWFLGVVESPKFNGSAWVAASKNTLPVTKSARGEHR